MKECFVIMPISNQSGYPDGHFDVVFQEIIIPACKKMDLNPYRAEMGRGSGMIIFDILKRLIESPYAICDISSRNPNVMFELGIRQAFDLPVVLLKDEKTEKIFDIDHLRYCSYHSSLWTKEVDVATKLLEEHLQKMIEPDSELTLVKLLGITAAKVKNVEVSSDTKLILDKLDAVLPFNATNKFKMISVNEMMYEGNRYRAIDWMTQGFFMYLQYKDLIFCEAHGFGKVVWLVKNNQGIVIEINIVFFATNQRLAFKFQPNFFKEVTLIT